MGIFIGYARVSTTDQTLALQEAALNKADCKRIFRDTSSGAKADRPGLAAALDYVREGDTLVVWKLDRLGRSLQHLIATLTTLEQRGIGFKSLTENIDTTTPGGKLIFHIFGALAEFERDLIRERTAAGLSAARARGRQGGRPSALSRLDPQQVTAARHLYQTQQMSVKGLCKMLKISPATFYRTIASTIAEPEQPQPPKKPTK